MTRIIVLAWLALVAGCGGEATSPPTPAEVPGPPTFRVAAGTTSDTIGARLVAAIQVSVLDWKSRPLTNSAVTLRVIPDRVLIDPGVVVHGGSADTLVTLRTSPSGAATFDVSLSKYPGTFDVAVTVDGVARQDTVKFTVLPGQAATMRLVSRDTLGSIDVPYRPSVIVADRMGNRRTDQPTLTTTRGDCRVSDGAVTASTVAQCVVAARLGTFRDSLILTVVPRARVTATTYAFSSQWIATMNLDGSDVKLIRAIKGSTFDAIHPVLAPTGMLASIDVGNDNKTHVQIIDPSGDAKFIPVDLPLGAEQTWPIFAADGQSVFFSACNWPIFEHCRVWQTKLDGSQPRILSPSATSTGQRSNWITLTPDGRTLVYAARGSRVHTLDLQTGRDVDLGFPSELFSVDPSGSRLAYTRYVGGILDGLFVSNLDGTNARQVAPGSGFYSSVQWLRGGEWVMTAVMIADSPSAGHGGPRVLVNVNTGEIVPFKYNTPVDEVWVTR